VTIDLAAPFIQGLETAFPDRTVLNDLSIAFSGSLKPANYLFACSEHVFGDLLDSDAAPAIWVCGHTHHPVDVTVGRTRIVCNPRGYMRVRASARRLRWDLIIDTEDLP
jgi:hypothetical protein